MAFHICTTQATPLRLLLLLLLLAVRLRGVTPHAAGCPRSRAASALAAHGCVAALPRTTSGECTDRQSRPAAIQEAQQQRVSNTHTACCAAGLPPAAPSGACLLPRRAGSWLAGGCPTAPRAAGSPRGAAWPLPRLIMQHDAPGPTPGRWPAACSRSSRAAGGRLAARPPAAAPATWRPNRRGPHLVVLHGARCFLDTGAARKLQRGRARAFRAHFCGRPPWPRGQWRPMAEAHAAGLWWPGTQLALPRPSHNSHRPSQLPWGRLHAASRSFDRPGAHPLLCWPALPNSISQLGC